MIILVPSRGRPNQAAGMAVACKEMAEGEVRVQLIVDADDDTVNEYVRLYDDVMVLDERIGYGASLNAAAAKVVDDHRVIGAFGDDVVFRTPGWDTAVADALSKSGIGLVYPNDGYFGESFATGVFVRSEVVKALGWLAYPRVWHQYVDSVWYELGKAANAITYLPDVLVEHMHPGYNKGTMDATYESVYSQPQAGRDYEAFHRWRAEAMAEDVTRLRGALS